jgi:uncharacterized protein (DUF58 family)
MRSRRRGLGFDLAGSRPYRPGDDIRAIDHRASARLSSARGDDQLVVREYLTDEATRVVVVVDRRPSMGLFPEGLPWLSKPAAIVESVRVILASAADAHCAAGMLDCSGPPVWLAPSGRASAEELIAQAGLRRFEAPPSGLDDAVRSILQVERDLRAGTFVLILSDFIEGPSDRVLNGMLSRGWDVVPVVMQDPVWEQSFPPVAGVALRVANPVTGDSSDVRLTETEADVRREANQGRRDALGRRFASLGLDVVELSSAEPSAVLEAFSAWAVGRRDGARTLR